MFAAAAGADTSTTADNAQQQISGASLTKDAPSTASSINLTGSSNEIIQLQLDQINKRIDDIKAQTQALSAQQTSTSRNNNNSTASSASSASNATASGNSTPTSSSSVDVSTSTSTNSLNPGIPSTASTASNPSTSSTSGTATTSENQICLVPYIPWNGGNYFLAEYKGEDPRINEIMVSWKSAVSFYHQNSIPMLPTELNQALGNAGIEVVFDKTVEDLVKDLEAGKCGSSLNKDDETSASSSAKPDQDNSKNRNSQAIGIPNSSATPENIPNLRKL